MPGIPPQARAGLAARRVAFVAAALTVACASAPPLGQDVISAVEIRGDAIAEDPELEVGLATHEDEPFDQDVLEKDLERIRRYYRARGHYDAVIRAARVVRVAKGKVRVEIEVAPGAPVLVSRIDLVGIDALPRDLAEAARDA